MANTIFMGDIGTVIRINTGEALDAATTLELHMVKPGGTNYKETCTLDPDDSKIMQFTSDANTFDEIGTYVCQAYVEQANGNWYGEVVNIVVNDPVAAYVAP